jgi:hypothetical protein
MELAAHGRSPFFLITDGFHVASRSRNVWELRAPVQLANFLLVVEFVNVESEGRQTVGAGIRYMLKAGQYSTWKEFAPRCP